MTVPSRTTCLATHLQASHRTRLVVPHAAYRQPGFNQLLHACKCTTDGQQESANNNSSPEQKLSQKPVRQLVQPETSKLIKQHGGRSQGAGVLHPRKINHLIVDAATAAAVLRVYAEHKSSFNAINLTTALHRLVKHCKLLSQERQQAVRDHPDTVAMASETVARLDEFDCQTAANIAWAQAVMQLGPPEFLPQVLKHATHLITDNGHVEDAELSTICWAAAKQQCLSRDVWDVLSPILCARLPELSPRFLSNVIWACATMGYADDTVFLEAAATRTIHQSTDLHGQSLANIAWAFAKLNYFDKQLFDALSAQAIICAPHLSGMDLAHVTWAVCHAYSAEAASQGIDVLAQVQTKTFARGFIARAKRGILLKALRNQATKLMYGTKPVSSVAMATWLTSFASIGYYSPVLHDLVADYLVRIMDRTNLQSIINIVWGCSVQRHYHPRLFTAFAKRGLGLLADPLTASQFSPLVISTVASSFASHTVDEKDQASQDFIWALAERAHNTLEQFDAQALANTAWGLAVGGNLHPPFFRKLRRLIPAMMGQLGPKELQQLYQVELILRLEAPDLGLDTSHDEHYEPMFAALQEWGQLAGAARARWRHQMGPSHITTSVFQQDVALALASVSLPCKLEVEYVATDYTIDMALPSMRLAIEADGPLHFMRNVARPAGRTLVKRRSLQQMGWTVLSVPYFHWDQLQAGPLMKQVYMQERLRQVKPSAVSNPLADASSLDVADMQTVSMLVAESAQLGLLLAPTEDLQLKHTQAQVALDGQPDTRSLTAAEVLKLKQSASTQQQHQLLKRKAGKSKLSRYELLLEVAKRKGRDTIE